MIELERLSTLEVLFKNKFSHGDWIIEQIEIVPPFEIPKGEFIGLDPGTTNFGICILENNRCRTYKIKSLRDKNPVVRMVNTKNLLSYVINYFQFINYVCIEGASYGDIYRQVELAEIRAASVFWALEHKMEVKIAQPSEIRKRVFGNGTIKGKDIWKKYLSGDAADAVACAYFASSMSI
jgi:Holliday junction resolvasome RuvABC endonuclease subunit